MKKKLQVIFLLLLLIVTISSSSSLPAVTSNSSSEASALYDFKSKADLHNNLIFTTKTFRYCTFPGIKCSKRGKITHLVLENFNFSGGAFAPDTLSRLDQLRVLSLRNNSLAGEIPNLVALANLKSLFLGFNLFAGSFPASLVYLHRVRTVDLSFNRFSGSIPVWLTKCDQLYSLRLDFNRFEGSVPAFNQSSLLFFNVSHNNLSGAIPVTVTLLRVGASSFSRNIGLCGEIIHKECSRGSLFFGSPVASPPQPSVVALGQNAELNGVNMTNPVSNKKLNRFPLILGFSIGLVVLFTTISCFIIVAKIRNRRNRNRRKQLTPDAAMTVDSSAAAEAASVTENELEEKVKKKVEGMQVAKSGNLVFCAGEQQVYTLDQLMRGSADLLGRGTMGATYKAVLDNRLIVCVKRMDSGKTAGTSQEMFEQHMGSVGGLRHPNLVPLRAYFQAKDERLLIYDYQPNGSLFSLIHGSKSTRAKPLHWTSCLKIAEDMAQGLSYIHQAWRLIHGNLKSSNVLLGPDFEACLADYCLSVIVTASPTDEEADSAAYKSPELLKSNALATSKSDVYAFGILLLELISGKPPSQLPHSTPNELLKWVKSTREDDGGDDTSLVMLVDVAIACSTASPEQRPTMWQVLKMIQEIKETLFAEDEDSGAQNGVP